MVNDPNAEGVVQKQRKILIPLKDKFDQHLGKWEELDINDKAGEKSTEWCSNNSNHTKKKMEKA